MLVYSHGNNYIANHFIYNKICLKVFNYIFNMLTEYFNVTKYKRN